MSYVIGGNDFVTNIPEVQNSRTMSQPQLTEYELKSIQSQREKLKYFTDTTNDEVVKQHEHELFTNLSLSSIFTKFSTVIISIINQLLAIDKNTSASDIVYIFIRDDRLIYIGLLLMIIALCIYLVDITQ